MATIYATNQIM